MHSLIHRMPVFPPTCRCAVVGLSLSRPAPSVPSYHNNSYYFVGFGQPCIFCYSSTLNFLRAQTFLVMFSRLLIVVPPFLIFCILDTCLLLTLSSCIHSFSWKLWRLSKLSRVMSCVKISKKKSSRPCFRLPGKNPYNCVIPHLFLFTVRPWPCFRPAGTLTTSWPSWPPTRTPSACRFTATVAAS